jgi:hypothetical protein
MRWIATVTLVLLMLASVGCPEEKGPMERAGEAIDESIDKLTHPNEGALEKAGRKADEALDDARKAAAGED